ncbi:MAG TPA: hypothetical protein VGI54_12070 [Solirubrobacteraceae bacterium]
MEEHRQRQVEALRVESEAQRALMAGEESRASFAGAAELYRESWELAPPDAYGRLVGALKAAVLAGQGGDMAGYVRGEIVDPGESATAWYALALAALTVGDDAEARAAAARMEATSPGAPAGEGGGGPDPFVRTARAIDALATGDAAAYAEALQAIVSDFEARAHFVANVAVADTAVVLERLAAARGLATDVRSAVLPG